MKKIIIISIIALFTSFVSTATAKNYPEEYLGLPGDNLNLYATMKLFQESETLEDFERSLNDQNSQINNLDLNGDNLVDYITVTDYLDGNVHTIVLRAALSRDETQDIAVFTVERLNDRSARLQLIGDEALYGRNYIVEPIYSDSQETPNPGYIGNSRVVETPTVVAVTTYQVAAWPIIRFIYRPNYTCWHSSWSWGYYPTYWNPWRPYYWHTYHGYHTHFNHYYYGHYRQWNHYRYHRYNDFYYSHVRTYSPRVSSRIREGNYKTTYSRPDLRKRGDELYNRTARRSTESGVVKSGSRSRVSNSRPAVNKSSSINNSSSGRRSVSSNSTRTDANSSINRRSGDTRKSTTIQSGRATTSTYPANKKAVSQRTENRSSAPYKSGTVSSTSRKKEVQPKSTTVRTGGSSSVRQSSSQTNRSSSTYSNKSASKPKVSSSSRSSSRQPKASAGNNSSGSRSSKATNKSSQSKSSSGERSGRR